MSYLKKHTKKKTTGSSEPTPTPQDFQSKIETKKLKSDNNNLVSQVDEFGVPSEEFEKRRKEGLDILNDYNKDDLIDNVNKSFALENQIKANKDLTESNEKKDNEIQKLTEIINKMELDLVNARKDPDIQLLDPDLFIETIKTLSGDYPKSLVSKLKGKGYNGPYTRNIINDVIVTYNSLLRNRAD